ncbi:hypothetical protein [Deinococcus aluminii]|uniref:Uncharacterized protein n=1 Tax=Deinococcus aluminii TaxID=1656885 RepID=A0ABP9XGZ0_9DEIO
MNGVPTLASRSELRRELRALERLVREGRHPDGRPATLAEEARAAADIRQLKRLLR